MAKKKRKEVKPEEEEYEFVPPEFDEKAFLEKDILGTKTLMITAGLAVVFGLIGFLLSTVVIALGFVALLVGLFLLRYIYPLFKIPVEGLERKSMIGNYLLFFLLFLGIWVLTLNPPFSDMANPEVDDVQVWYSENEGAYVLADLSQSVFSIPDGGVSLNITATVTDNGNLEKVTIKLYEIGDEATATAVDMEYVGDDIYEYRVDLNLTEGGSKSTYFFVIEAEDSGGNTVVSDTYRLS